MLILLKIGAAYVALYVKNLYTVDNSVCDRMLLVLGPKYELTLH